MQLHLLPDSVSPELELYIATLPYCTRIQGYDNLPIVEIDSHVSK